jgi:hypothetical protein
MPVVAARRQSGNRRSWRTCSRKRVSSFAVHACARDRSAAGGSAIAAITGTPWLLVVGLAGHGVKDLWQHRTHFVANTKWWPPFCLVVDFVVAAIIVVEIIAGVHFHH